MLLTTQANYLSAQIHVFEAEIDACIQEVEEITCSPPVVDELHLVCTSETCHTQQQLGIVIHVVAKEYHSGIGGLAVIQEFEFGKQRFHLVAFCRRIDTSTSHAQANYTTDAILVQVGNRHTVCYLGIPSKFPRIASAQPFVVHFARHYLRRALYPIVRATLVSIRYLSVLPSVKVIDYQLQTVRVRHLDKLSPCVYAGFYLSQFLGYLPLGVVSHILACYLQRCWGDTEYQVASLRIEESTG